jgi:hypothetical protein
VAKRGLAHAPLLQGHALAAHLVVRGEAGWVGRERHHAINSLLQGVDALALWGQGVHEVHLPKTGEENYC